MLYISIYGICNMASYADMQRTDMLSHPFGHSHNAQSVNDRSRPLSEEIEDTEDCKAHNHFRTSKITRTYENTHKSFVPISLIIEIR